MKINPAAVRTCLKAFDFSTLFREHLGWDKHQATLTLNVDGAAVALSAVAEKRGFVAFVCDSIPDRHIRIKIDHQVTKSVKEHFVIYSDRPTGQQVWHWVRREPGKPLASRDHRFQKSQSGDRLIQRLEQIAVSLDEEDALTLVDVNADVKAAFDVDRITKRFYEQFKTEHAAFLKFIKGIDVVADLEWYTSLMLNRLMFVYFIQKKGFLDGDSNYLRNRMKRVRELRGSDKFQTFYRYFLLRLFQEGLGKATDERKLDPTMEALLGRVPYLNGGFFEVHQLEERHGTIDIPDKAFERLFDFFDRYAWHLDDRPLRTDNEINPDVVGYIFEKYINQKQMGAYYTKEDITEYISKNAILPFLFDVARKTCPIAFEPNSFLWRLLRDDPDRYIYSAVRHGVTGEDGVVIPLPPEIAAGIDAVSKRGGWNRSAAEPFALPTETWREHVTRRTRCLEIREKLKAGSIQRIDDLVTLNLDIWQFARDAILYAEGPELVRAFWEAIDKITVLDPTCGSGAFLFAALRILETLYADCLERMERFVEDHGARPHHPEQFADFKKVLTQIDSHPNEQYFILKSIIVDNLFGVDIMEEAVEICKLRLFLKLAAQVESADKIEPLPDIDFNIRAGNSLVGYATKQDARRAFTESASGQGKLMLGDADKAYDRFEESAAVVERAFRQFRDQQTTHGGRITLQDKQELRRRLAVLDGELDAFLAGEYGIKPKNKTAFEQWRATHQPFHWFVHFYGIMRNGGFDVVIGNPPYVEYSKVRDTYRVLPTYQTLPTGNLYALLLERSQALARSDGAIGKIVPLSLVCTDRAASARQLLSVCQAWVSTYDMRPACLFDGVAQRLCIVLYRNSSGMPRLHTGGYRRWTAEERPGLIQRTAYVESSTGLGQRPIPKLGEDVERSVLAKITGHPLSHFVKDGSKPLFVHRIVRYFVKALDFVPLFVDASGKRGRSEDYKPFQFDERERTQVLATLNSTTFYWFWRTHSDGFHCGYGDVHEMPHRPVAPALRSKLARIVETFEKDLRTESKEKSIKTKAGVIRYQEFYPSRSKAIIDRFDSVLADHYGFTSEERDFIINYDIKYRVGADEESDDE
jgi:hypothetical protein